MRIHWLSPIAAALLGACTIGTTPGNFQPAIAPGGVHASLEIFGAQEPVVGELVSVSDSALLVATTAPALVLVHYQSIQSGNFRQVGTLIRDRATPALATRERLRLVSRFPQGVTPDLLESLMRSLHVSNVTVQ
jgi:hypothetical protein